VKSFKGDQGHRSQVDEAAASRTGSVTNPVSGFSWIVLAGVRHVIVPL
jgi:hypothetical protein